MSILGLVFLIILLSAALALVARTIWHRTRLPLYPMTVPSTKPFPIHYAKQAAREQRLVWVKYQNPDGRVTEGQVEFYRVTWKGEILGWCRTRRCRCTFKRDQVLAWQILDERFDRIRNMEHWARWTSWIDGFRQHRDERRR